MPDRPRLTIDQVLSWADDHHKRHGEWPQAHAGPVRLGPLLNWRQVDNALRYGFYGLVGGSSVAKLLAEHRAVRSWSTLPRLTEKQVLVWADQYRQEQGRWPTQESGPLGEEDWRNIDWALREGGRGLPGGSSVAKLLAKHRGHRHNFNSPKLALSRVLLWADEYHARHGVWPTRDSGPIPRVKETWAGIATGLARGARGLPKTTLADLLRTRRGRRNKANLPSLTDAMILTWADEHKKRTGRWPNQRSTVVPDAPREKWKAIDLALRDGYRGLPGRSSLAKLLAKHRGVRNKKELPRLNREDIACWADAFFAQHGYWPTHASGPIPEAPGETWKAVDQALRAGLRGLPKGSSLTWFLFEAGRAERVPGERYARVGKRMRWPMTKRGNVPLRKTMR